MRLKEYAKKQGVVYRTAQNWYYARLIEGAYKKGGTIIIPESNTDAKKVKEECIVIYCRVSSSQNKDNLNTQADRLINYCNARGYRIHDVVKEVGSGINDKRSKLKKILEDEKITKIVVEHKDRLTRFGFNYIYLLLKRLGVEIEVVNNVSNDEEDIIQDFTSIITSFCSRIYGYRRTRRKTEKLINELKKDAKDK